MKQEWHLLSTQSRDVYVFVCAEYHMLNVKVAAKKKKPKCNTRPIPVYNILSNFQILSKRDYSSGLIWGVLVLSELASSLADASLHKQGNIISVSNQDTDYVT